jgi:hypothetical protein
MARNAGIYVEIGVRADVDEIWRRTQLPDLHEMWDLRFTRIQYLPRQSEAEPQRFLYSTRIGFGLKIEGEGESTGTREDHGLRTSALKFWSSDPKSLIAQGAGYWRYIPANEKTRFLTWYDYQPRLGAAGRMIDKLIFRPLLGWATAWSFDRLRLWIERDISPRVSLRMAVIHALARLAIALVWFWQGLMPKLMFPNIDEKVMMTAAHLPLRLLPIIGGIELLFAAGTLVLWRWQPLFLVNVLLMIVATAVVAVSTPSYLVGAFNPITLNALMVFISVIGYAAAKDLPSSSQCLRTPRETK